MAATTPKPAAPPPPPPPPQQSKPPRNPTEPPPPPPPPPNTSSNPNPPAPPKPLPLLTPTQEDISLSRATHLTRLELLRRRSRYLKQLSRCYRDYYWALMEELKIQYREYYWKFGVSPFKQDQVKNGGEGERERENGLDIEGIGENIEGNGNNNNINANNNNNSSNNNNNNLGVSGNNNVGGSSGGNHRCAFVGCKLKAMALTNFCHLHILSDSKQKLYKACSYVIKSAQAGPITCGKPILRSTVPSLCTVHLAKTQKHVSRALKKAGLNVNLSTKVAPKFHVIAAEYVRQIQAKRRAAQRAITNNVVVKEETAG